MKFWYFSHKTWSYKFVRALGEILDHSAQHMKREHAQKISPKLHPILHSPASPYPQNLGGEDSPPKFKGGVSETPCFTVFFEGRPPPSVNLGGEASPLNLGDMG